MENKSLVKVDKKVISNENMQILVAIKNLDIDTLNEEEVKALSTAIVTDVNLSKMGRAVNYACADLSRVGPVKFTAEAAPIARENQERLELICRLLDTYGNFEQTVKCLRRNKNNCRENYDQVYGLLLRTSDLADAVLEHSDFKIKEREENNRYVNMLLRKRERELEESKTKLLGKGDE